MFFHICISFATTLISIFLYRHRVNIIGDCGLLLLFLSLSITLSVLSLRTPLCCSVQPSATAAAAISMACADYGVELPTTKLERTLKDGKVVEVVREGYLCKGRRIFIFYRRIFISNAMEID